MLATGKQWLHHFDAPGKGTPYSPLWLMSVLHVFWGRRSFIDPICRTFLHGFVHVFKVGDSCPPQKDTWYGVILWVLRVLGQSLDQSARIFFTRAFWLLRHTDEPQVG